MTQHIPKHSDLQLLAESITEYAIFMLNTQGHVVSWSAGGERLKGYRTEEILGKHFSIFYTPEDLMAGKPEQALKEAEARGQFENEGWRVRKDGTRFFAHVLITALRDESGNLRGFAKVTRDVTEQRRAEDALRRWEYIFRYAGWGVAILNVHTYALDTVNPAFAQMHGYTLEELRGRSLVDLLAPESRKTMPVHASIARETGHHRFEAFHLRRDGTRFPVATDVMVIQGEGGPALYGVANFQDITDQKRADESLRKTNEELESRVRARTAELAKMNHELQIEVIERVRVEEQLRNSLGQLRALAGRLQSAREEERSRLAREIHDQLGQACTALKMDTAWLSQKLPKGDEQARKRAEAMLTLIDETIQCVRRIASELRPSTLDDLGLVAAVEWQTQEFESRTGIKCRISLPTEEIALEPERSTAVFRIFQETLTNVARHAQASLVDVKLMNDPESLTLEVHDNGRGFDTDHPASKSLGLLGMKERVALIGGEFKIASFAGSGTTMTVRVPWQARARQAEQSGASHPVRPDARSIKRGSHG